MRHRRNQLHGLSAALAAGALLVALGSAPAARAGVESRDAGVQATALPADPSAPVVLSDEQTFTRWAYAVMGAPIRSDPSPGASRLGSLNLSTEDGFPEVYLLLKSWTDADGTSWLQVRVPARPNGAVGWVEASALGAQHLVTTQLVVDRQRLRAILYDSGQRVWWSQIGVGKRNTPTPAGRFWIRERIRSGNPLGFYGPWAFGTSAYSRLSDWPGGGVVGIHGTSQPNLIPGRPSHGCIRVPNWGIRRLAHLMPIGTPVWIR